MFRRWLNRATIQLTLSPRGPVLIKSGLESADPTRPAMEFVRSRHALYGETVYLPGTSLKGALRSHAERVLSGLGVKICNPFDRASECRRATRGRRDPGARDERSPTGAEVFGEQCPACQTFGSLALGGRCNVEDAYPWAQEEVGDGAAANATETRWQVGIDRRTGQAQGSALFELEVVVGGAFHTTIHLENFQLWQLGLVGALLDDVKAGDVPIGFGKSRGLGQVEVKVQKVEVEMLRGGKGKLLGAGALVSTEEAKSYRLEVEAAMDPPPGVEARDTWRGQRYSVRGDSASGLLKAAIEGPLKAWIDRRTLPQEKRA
jgi:CRISPR/Cas system CSM-associated protein Csm3 (group 7 of RAMP superfamily)